MRVKRYVVDSMPNALQRIRTDLGKDAVILNTKEIRIGGFLGLFSKKRIEVIAATDTAALQQQAQPASFPGQAQTVELPAFQEPVRAPVTVLEKEWQAETNLQQATRAEAAAGSNEELLLKEMRQMKEMLRRFSASDAGNALSEVLRPIEQRLLEQEISPALVSEMMNHTAEAFAEAPDEFTMDNAVRHVREQLLSILKSDKPAALGSDTKIAHFVGPTGVGKTTTIAKLAAEQVLKASRKVGFITADTYRIAAVEQLRTYANILNVPLEVVFSPQEMTKAFRRLAECDLIFMDTAGRNYRNEMYVSELNALLKGNGPSETFLVMSLTSKYQDMKAITENFAKFKIDSILYTKMDETETLGSIVNLAYDFDLCGSYMTNGQNVPDDIEKMNPERIVDLIMGGIGHE